MKALLTLDLGNTALSGAVWKDGRLTRPWFIQIAKGRFGSRLETWLRGLGRKEEIGEAILASVVPAHDPVIAGLCRKILGVPCRRLRDRLPPDLTIRYHRPRDVGADRLANAIGAYCLYGGPAIVVDFGTAITFDVVSRKFEYLGGAIAPGLQISAEALFQKTALLPTVEITIPERVLGQDTVSAIRSGVYFGTLGLVERVARELKKELGWGREVKMIATGGQARLILSRSRLIRVIDPYLTLRGLYIAATGDRGGRKAHSA
jgi:type III pantothenate kinase